MGLTDSYWCFFRTVAASRWYHWWSSPRWRKRECISHLPMTTERFYSLQRSLLKSRMLLVINSKLSIEFAQCPLLLIKLGCKTDLFLTQAPRAMWETLCCCDTLLQPRSVWQHLHSKLWQCCPSVSASYSIMAWLIEGNAGYRHSTSFPADSFDRRTSDQYSNRLWSTLGGPDGWSVSHLFIRLRTTKGLKSFPKSGIRIFGYLHPWPLSLHLAFSWAISRMTALWCWRQSSV